MLVPMQEKNGKIVVTSLQVAQDFEKDHAHVCRDIQNLMNQNPILVSDKYFLETPYKAGTGKSYKAYDLTRDGFSLLVMGFTGKTALQWKLKYIDTFNKMEAVVKKVASGVMPSPEEAKRIRAQAMLLNAKTRAFKTVKASINDQKLSPIALQLYGLTTIENLLGEKVGHAPDGQKLYTATEIANAAHCSSKKVGAVAKAHGMQTDPSEYGIWALDKSPYCAKQVSSFRYNEKGKSELLRLLKEAAA